jgi:hypothetical protein
MRKSKLGAIPLALSLLSVLASTSSLAGQAIETQQTKTAGDGSKHTELKLPDTGTLAIEVIQSQDAQRKQRITEQARKLFNARDFDGLEKLGNDLCKDKSIQQNGYGWSDSFINAISGMVTNTMTDSRWDRHLKKISEWEEKKPDSVLPKAVKVSTLANYAWKARGGGWANSVTEEGWRLFGERLARAEQVLTDADRLPQTCPTLFKAGMTVALGNSWKRERMEALFRKCVKLFPDYMSVYESKYIFLMPRWGGAEGDAEAFLEESADKHGKGAEGDKFYARLLWNMGTYLDRKTFTDTAISWPRAKAGFEALLKEYPDSLTVLTEYAKVAEYADDKTISRALLKKIGNRCDASVWNYEGAWAKWYFGKFREHVLSNRKSSDPTDDE